MAQQDGETLALPVRLIWLEIKPTERRGIIMSLWKAVKFCAIESVPILTGDVLLRMSGK